MLTYCYINLLHLRSEYTVLSYNNYVDLPWVLVIVRRNALHPTTQYFPTPALKHYRLVWCAEGIT